MAQLKSTNIYGSLNVTLPSYMNAISCSYLTASTALIKTKLGVGADAGSYKCAIWGTGGSTTDLYVTGRIASNDGTKLGGIWTGNSEFIGDNADRLGFFNAQWWQLIDSSGNVVFPWTPAVATAPNILIGPGSPVGKILTCVYSSSAVAGNITSIYNEVKLQPTGAVTTYIRGIHSVINFPYSVSYSDVTTQGSVAVYGEIAGTTATISQAHGVIGAIKLTAVGCNIVTATGVTGLIDTAGTITSATCLRASSSNAGAIATGYGLYIDRMNATTAYGIYQSTNQQNQFAGRIGIGAAAVVGNFLHVQGNTNLVGELSSSATRDGTTLSNGKTFYQWIKLYINGVGDKWIQLYN
jgi:hypothetical protein